MGPQAPLTRDQRRALALAQRAGRLERWDGGFWSYPGCAATTHLGGRRDLPRERVGTQTVSALVRKGLLALEGENAALLTAPGRAQRVD